MINILIGRSKLTAIKDVRRKIDLVGLTNRNIKNTQLCIGPI